MCQEKVLGKYCESMMHASSFLIMALPSDSKRDARPIQVSMKLSEKAVSQLKTLAGAHNLSQASVVEYLILQEFKEFQSKKGRAR